jgi:hypothetical protein
MTETIFVGRCRTMEGVRLFASTDPDMVMAHMAEYAYASEVSEWGEDATPRQRFEMMGHDEYLNKCAIELSDNNWELARLILLNDWPDANEYKSAEEELPVKVDVGIDIAKAQLMLIAMTKLNKQS